MTGADLAQLVGAHALHRLVIRLGVVLDGDLGRHAAHGMDTALVAGLDEELDLFSGENARSAQLCFFFLLPARETPKKHRG